MKKLTMAFIAMLAILTSCKKDADKQPDGNNNTSRVVRYELTGNFTGQIIASYTTAAGGTANDEVTSLPWSKEITYAPNVTAAILAVSGGGGVAGQKVTVIRKRGGQQIGTPTEITAQSNGGFSEAAPVIVF